MSRDPEKQKEYNRKYTKENPEKRALWSHNHYEKNKEHMINTASEFYYNNRERVLKQRRDRYAELKDDPEFIAKNRKKHKDWRDRQKAKKAEQEHAKNQ